MIAILQLLFLSAAASPTQAPESGRLALSLGEFSTLDEPSFLELGAEWRFPEWHFGLAPVAGATWFEGSGGYVYGGLRMELPIFESGYLAPGLAAGLYDHDRVDLGGAVHFRSSIEVGWRMSESASLGLTFYHLSNSSLEDLNPGSESLVLTLSFAP